MAKIIVTGGAGFIGSHIVDMYVGAGHSVAVVDDLSYGKKENVNRSARFYKVDLRNEKAVNKVIAREKPEVISHQAAQKSVNDSVKNPRKDAQINILGFLNLMETAKEHGVKKVIFSSTGGAIYGDTKNIPTPETELPKPESPYGITKFCSENYLRFYMSTTGIKTVVLRYANVFGPRQDPHGEAGVIAIFSQLLSQDKPLTVFGNGKQTRDYAYVEDVARASLKALTYSPKDFDSAVLNIGTGKETSLLNIIKLLEKAADKTAKIDFAKARTGDLMRSAINPQKAKKLLDWQADISLEEGIANTYKNFKSI